MYSVYLFFLFIFSVKSLIIFIFLFFSERAGKGLSPKISSATAAATAATPATSRGQLQLCATPQQQQPPA